jgi:hypothetical protein
MVWCSICSKGIVTSFACNVLGTTHLKIGISAYLLNDAYTGNKNSYEEYDAFQIFCTDWYALGHYHKSIIDKYPDILQKYSQAQINKLTAQYNKNLEEQRIKMAATEL